MWWVTTDVAVTVCGRYGLWPLRSVAIPVCGHSGLWPFRFVAVSVCGRYGLWPFWFVAVSVCGRFDLWPFRFVAVSVCGRSGLWPFRFVAVSVVAVSVCGRYDLLPFRRHKMHSILYTRVTYGKWFRLQQNIKMYKISVAHWNIVIVTWYLWEGSIWHNHVLSCVALNSILNKQLIWWWYHTPWRSYGFIVIHCRYFSPFSQITERKYWNI